MGVDRLRTVGYHCWAAQRGRDRRWGGHMGGDGVRSVSGKSLGDESSGSNLADEAVR